MTKEEERIRKIEDALLILPSELEKITDTQAEIVEHLEIINGTFGDLDDRVHKVETKWDYQEKNKETKKEEKKESKNQFFNLTNLIIALIVATQGLIVLIFALP